jgi:hypothetical protein
MAKKTSNLSTRSVAKRDVGYPGISQTLSGKLELLAEGILQTLSVEFVAFSDSGDTVPRISTTLVPAKAANHLEPIPNFSA